MARCPYLEYKSRGAFFLNGSYSCELSKKLLSDSEVNNKCNTSYGYNYDQCSFYKKRQEEIWMDIYLS
ncbi:MAG: hypothetical protein IKT38_04500 [Clostridia bacterium]|nr:hypothetical protein [Clostridia bacterium]